MRVQMSMGERGVKLVQLVTRHETRPRVPHITDFSNTPVNKIMLHDIVSHSGATI